MTRRGQLVLVAAVVAALALVPVAAAYLQFGYAPGVADTDADRGERVVRELDRLGDGAAERATGRAWSEREAAVRELRAALGPRVDTLETSRLGDAVAVRITENESAAASVACPTGPGRAFGNCERDGGVLVQERANETVVVAVALDVRVTTPDGTTRFVHVIRPH